MKIKWYSNACVQITSNSGGSILCDPWVNPGANLGSWFQWPPVPDCYEQELINLDIDGIFISHLHSDHYDPKFISKFTKSRPETPIYIPSFSHPWLKESLHKILKNEKLLIELPTLEKIEVGAGLTLEAFAADTCNPIICGQNIPCHTDPSLRGIDGIAVFRGDGLVIVNANDAMSINLVPKIAANIGKADVLMGHYGAASPFPQCFPQIIDKASEAQKVIKLTCENLISAAHALGAEHIFPFAGQYLLGGKLSILNKDLAVLPLDETVAYLEKITQKSILSVKPFHSIDFDNLSGHDRYIEPSKEILDEYLSEISKYEYIYERQDFDEWKDYKENLSDAASTVIRKSTKSRIGLDNSFIITDGKHSVTLNLYVDSAKNHFILGEIAANSTITKITIPENLLRMLCMKRENFKGFTPLHWNQADGGSHFTWERVGDFDLSSHMLLNFFGS